ncbi:hypothetical protein STRDD13_00723 [Streptococcus sp. DD13]|nr:hypothetical protein STRDD13_00723 [Streptococcus sp. DD13]
MKILNGKYQVLATEDNTQNGMRVMATAAIIARNGYKSR